MLISWAHQQIAGGTEAPALISSPVVSGDIIVGDTLTTTNGDWTGNPAPSFSYQWQRDQVNIAGATAGTYVLVEDDIGTMIRAVVTATNFRGSASGNSNEVGPIEDIETGE